MSNPIAVIICDTHLQSSNIEENFDIYNQVIKYCLDNGIKQMIHLGDALDGRKAQPLSVLNSFGEILNLFHKNDLQLTIIPGNHSKVQYSSEDSYLDEFKHHPNVNIYRDYQIDFINENEYWHFIPYFDESINYIDYLNKAINEIKKIDNEKARHILFTHVSVKGIFNNDNKEVDNLVDRKLFKPFYKVFIGHIHNASIMDNIYYIGSAFPHNFAEDNDKGLTVLYEDGSHKQVKLKFKEYYNIYIDIDKDSFNIENLLKQNANSENFIRFTFFSSSGSTEKLKSIDKTKFEAVGIDVKIKLPNLEKGMIAASKNEFISFNKEGILTEFEEFKKLNKLTEEQILIGDEYIKKQFNV